MVAASPGVLLAQAGRFDIHARQARAPLRLEQIGIVEAIRFSQAIDTQTARLGVVAAGTQWGLAVAA